MKKIHSLLFFLLTFLLGPTLIVQAQATSSAGVMTSQSTMGGPDENMTVTAPSDAPAPTANDGDVTNDNPEPATVDNGEPIARSDGTVDSSEVEEPNPEVDLTEGSPNFGNSLASGTVAANPPCQADAQTSGDLLNQECRTVTLESDGTIVGQPNVVAPSTAPIPTVAVPATGGAMGTASGSISGGAMGSTSGNSAGSSLGGGAFGK